MLYPPFCIFADFESLTEKVSGALPSTSASFTADLERHKAVSYSIIATDVDDKILFHEFYVGENAIVKFFETLKYLSDKLMARMHRIMPLIARSDDSYDPHICHICTKRFLPGEIRVRDHNHWGSGRINGLAHQACNLNYRATYFIPVVIHNSRNYDNNLILKSIPANIAKCIEIIPVNMEKFTMFSLDHLKFLDSYQFLDASLETLVQNLKKIKPSI
ncbi:hypothetical protein CDAR_176961 [Caerostris darwini]|uniref:Uncharacterized protein n=1 Tax=Caerostris darwini TaxID=1538125 RepID=A0AAV4RI40_9ARAC|nr:hypothetical protein CDAR_176961 [Caerostris darwini]